MNKKIIIAIVVIVLLGIAAYFLFQNKNVAPENTVVTSIKDALSKSASMECIYTDEGGTRIKIIYQKWCYPH